MAASLMPNQVYADTTSITAYGKHSAPPMSDLLVNEGSATISGFTTNDHAGVLPVTRSSGAEPEGSARERHHARPESDAS
jgi:hypothetical protein